MNESSSKRGKVPGSGKKKGTKNKKTIERERLAAQKYLEDRAREAREAAGASVSVEEARQAVAAMQAGGLKLGKQILSEFANALAGMAASIQPQNVDELNSAKGKLFREYAELALYAAEKVAPFESPRLGAMIVGQVQAKEIQVSGGLPAPNEPQGELPPDMYDDSEKKPDGWPERNSASNPADVPPRTSKVLSTN